MEIAARMSSKGQLTVPKVVRGALGVSEGDSVVFRVEGNCAVLAKTPEFLDLAGSFRVPVARRNAEWDEIVRTTRVARTATS
ncbi:MAG: AbrB/MazE/SpoVT family DNA-binding domain-containing protein [Ilumatobacteraceae bacterium]